MSAVKRLIEGGLIGGLGYLIGRQTHAEWEDFIKRYYERISHLTYNKILEPIGLYGKAKNSRNIYGEAVYAYLFGLPNASLPASFRCLELGLKKKYIEVEKKRPELSAYELIEWSENHLGNQK